MARKIRKDAERLSVIDDNHLPHNDMVYVEVLCLLCWDGDPETEGAEYYAPDDFDLEAHKKANGIDADNHDLLITGSGFETTLIQAQALESAKAVRIIL